jgi:uncharacterized protein (TIGR01777 family)
MRHLLITGGTGFIGTALCNHLLRQGDRLTVLTRDPEQAGLIEHETIRYVSTLNEIAAGESIDAVINLAGRSLNSGRWTTSLKEDFVASRVTTTRNLVAWMGRQGRPPSILISASAIGWYGHHDASPLTETSMANDGYSYRLCAAWEEAAREAEALGSRVVCLRIGIVLESDGGSLPAMLPAFRLGAGGPLGSGTQYWSWFHRLDLLRLIDFALREENLSGAVNATAPEPLPQREFAKALGHALHRPSFAPLPAFMARLMLGEFADELLLNGQRVMPESAVRQGFEFRFPTLAGALAEILAT